MRSFVLCSVAKTEGPHRALGDVLAPQRGRIEAPGTLDAWCDVAGVSQPEDPTPEGWAEHIKHIVESDPFEVRLLANGRPGVDYRNLGYLGAPDQPALFWGGMRTSGRWASWDPSPGGGVLRWDTGTGKPSWWMGRALLRAGLARVSKADAHSLAGRVTPSTHGRLSAISREVDHE